MAIAQLDETHATQQYEREKLRAEEYKSELEKCYAKMLMIGLDPSTFTAPQQQAKDLSMSMSMSSSQSYKETYIPAARGY